MLQRSSLRRALAVSVTLHVVAAAVAWWIAPARDPGSALIDVEVAPPAPRPEALPAAVARPPELPAARTADPDPAGTAPDPPPEAVAAPIDAGVDAPVDARPDAAVDARRDAAIDTGRDAAVDAAPDADITVAATTGESPEMTDAGAVVPDAALATSDDAGAPSQIALGDAGDTSPVAAVGATADAGTGPLTVAISDAGGIASAAPGSPAIRPGTGGPGSGSAAPVDTAALAAALAASPATAGPPGTSDEPAVDGEPTTAGTAANLLAYFPTGHVVTALIRFDRLRGTEWAAQTERLLQPLPDYRWLFGPRDAHIADTLDTLVISSPQPRDAGATTLVARTTLPRAALRDFLGATTPVTWSAATGGLLGKRTGKRIPGDQRVFLSPFRGWFLLAQPGDLGGLTTAARANLDTVEATALLPPWLAGIRTIEAETGATRGPALVVTLGGTGKRIAIPGADFGLDVSSVATPNRVSLAGELVAQGWLVRGNLIFASDADAAELIATVEQVQRRIADSRLIQRLIGKPIAHVVANLAFARSGPRVSYATSISIADTRAILAAAAQQLDHYFGRAP